jgi:hypothetical protein
VFPKQCSAKNREISIQKFCSTAKRFQTAIEISLEFLSGNRQYWNNIRALLTSSSSPALHIFSHVGIPRDSKNYCMSSPWKKREKHWPRKLVKYMYMHLLVVFLLMNHQCKVMNNLKLVINPSTFFTEGVAYMVLSSKTLATFYQTTEPTPVTSLFQLFVHITGMAFHVTCYK